MIKITADCCGKSVTVADGAADVHVAADAAGCACCPQDHHHGQAATETGTPCRPLTITMLPGSVQLIPEG